MSSLKNIYSGSVVINGAETITGYNAARSIEGMGFTIFGLTSNVESMYSQARVWDEIYDTNYGCEELISIAEKIMKDQKTTSRKPVLMLCQDDIVLLVSKHRDKLSKYFSFLLPSEDAIHLMMDKTAFYQWAITNNFDVPNSIIVNNINDIETALDTLQFPIAVKPLNRDDKWNHKFNNIKVFSFEARPPDLTILEDALNYTEKLIFQEWIPGSDSDVHFLLAMSGQVGMSSLCGRKLHQWPVLTGSTSMCITEIAPDYEDKAIHILKKAGLLGLGSIEFKRDPRTNKYYITEPTVGRHDYQSFIATKSGVNLSLLYVLECMQYSYISNFTPQLAIWIDEFSFIRSINQKKKTFILLIKALILMIKGKIAFATFNWRELRLFSSYFFTPIFNKVRRVLNSREVE